MTTTHIPVWTLGDRLRKAREDAGFSQVELAEVIGVSRNTISNHELGEGKRPPTPLLMRAWAAATAVPEEWLRTGTVPTEEPRPRRGQGPVEASTDTRPKRYSGMMLGNGQMTKAAAA